MKNLIYKGKIREGSVGTLTEEDYCVYYDTDLDYAYLDPRPVINYSDESYRISVNGSNDIRRYYELHEGIQTTYFELVKNFIKEESVVLEIGCAGGILLDKVKEKCFKTIGIEPNEEFQSSLRQRDHIIYSQLDDCIKDWQGKVDFIMSFHVIEHVEKPGDFIDTIGELLKPGGIAYVLTPNYNDILLKINFDAFAPFYFRKVHPFYLTVESMRKMVENSGMDFISPVYYHDFGFSNTLHWLKDKAPRGNESVEGVEGSLDEAWKDYLVKTGQTKDIAVIFSKR